MLRMCASMITALGLWLDCVSCTFVAVICYSFILMSQNGTTSSNVGLAISQALILTGMVQYGIRQMMESFQLFTNAERVMQYTKLEQEPLISRKPTRDWPFKGEPFNVISFSVGIHFLLVPHSSSYDWIQKHVSLLRCQLGASFKKFKPDHRPGNESRHRWKVCSRFFSSRKLLFNRFSQLETFL